MTDDVDQFLFEGLLDLGGFEDRIDHPIQDTALIEEEPLVILFLLCPKPEKIQVMVNDYWSFSKRFMVSAECVSTFH